MLQFKRFEEFIKTLNWFLYFVIFGQIIFIKIISHILILFQRQLLYFCIPFKLLLTHLHAYYYVILIGHMFLYYFNLNFVSFNYKSDSWIYFHCWNFILFVTLVPPLMTTPSTKALFKDNSCSHFEVHPSRFFPMHLHTYVSVEYLLFKKFHNTFVIYINYI